MSVKLKFFSLAEVVVYSSLASIILLFTSKTYLNVKKNFAHIERCNDFIFFRKMITDELIALKNTAFVENDLLYIKSDGRFLEFLASDSLHPSGVIDPFVSTAIYVDNNHRLIISKYHESSSSGENLYRHYVLMNNILRVEFLFFFEDSFDWENIQTNSFVKKSPIFIKIKIINMDNNVILEDIFDCFSDKEKPFYAAIY